MLTGRIVDGNAGPVAGEIAARGLDVSRAVIVGDHAERVAAEVAAAIADGVDLLVTTGGLGPTGDDVTMRSVAAGAGVGLEQNSQARDTVAQRTASVALDDGVRERLLDAQALLPVGATLIPAAGTAPGAVLTVERTLIVVLPGPPWERARMWEWTAEREPLASVLARGRPEPRSVLRIFGVSESAFVQELDRLEQPTAAEVSVGVCARDGELEVTIAGPERALAAATAHLAAAFGERLYSHDETGVDLAVHRALRARGQTLAVAESCTGGGLGERVTRTPGASDVFLGGVVAYSNLAKELALRVPPELVIRHGAVSAEVAAVMADEVRTAFGADWGLSITGIAGPGSGTADKPVGLVYIACAGPGGADVAEHHFRGDRDRIRERSAALALHMLRQAIDES